jgi:hypothetical protein
MIMLSEATGDCSYEQHAVRNLRMMLTYWEPDDSIFTANSTRFDRDRLIYPKDYYMEYLKMGMKYGIPEFLQMCNTIFEFPLFPQRDHEAGDEGGGELLRASGVQERQDGAGILGRIPSEPDHAGLVLSSLRPEAACQRLAEDGQCFQG